jgi:hypothetical protein
MSPASMRLTTFETAKDSISETRTVRTSPIALLSPRSMPPYPKQREACVRVLVVSTFLIGLGVL